MLSKYINFPDTLNVNSYLMTSNICLNFQESLPGCHSNGAEKPIYQQRPAYLLVRSRLIGCSRMSVNDYWNYIVIAS